MKFLSFDWFKSKKTEESETLKQIGELKEKLENIKDALGSILETDVGKEDDVITFTGTYQIELEPKITRKQYDGYCLTVCFDNGDVLQKVNATSSDWFAVKEGKTMSDVEHIMLDNSLLEQKEKEEQEKRKKEEEYQKSMKEYENIKRGIDLISTSTQFEVVDDSVYMKGINRTLPELLIKHLSEVLQNNTYSSQNDIVNDESLLQDEEFIALKRFWMWCCLNPRAEVSDRLYEFLKENGMKITKQGLFVALRNVVKVGNDSDEIVNVITNAYNKIKAVWKKNPEKYFIYTRLGEYKLVEEGKKPVEENPYWEMVGNLKELYLNIPDMEENRYTDDYTRSFDIRLGKKVSMKPEDCSWSTADCAERGLTCSPFIQ